MIHFVIKKTTAAFICSNQLAAFRTELKTFVVVNKVVGIVAVAFQQM